MVGAASLFDDIDVWIGHLGLSMEGVETYDVWRQFHKATGYWEPGERECAGRSGGRT